METKPQSDAAPASDKLAEIRQNLQLIRTAYPDHPDLRAVISEIEDDLAAVASFTTQVVRMTTDSSPSGADKEIADAADALTVAAALLFQAGDLRQASEALIAAQARAANIEERPHSMLETGPVPLDPFYFPGEDQERVSSDPEAAGQVEDDIAFKEAVRAAARLKVDNDELRRALDGLALDRHIIEEQSHFLIQAFERQVNRVIGLRLYAGEMVADQAAAFLEAERRSVETVFKSLEDQIRGPRPDPEFDEVREREL